MSTIEPTVPPPTQLDAIQGDVKLSSVARFIVYGAACVLVSDIPNAVPGAFFAARLVIAGLLYATLILPPRAAATLLLVISLSGQDIVSGTSVEVDHMTAAVWQISIGPLNPSFLFFACLLYQLARIPLYSPARPVRCALVWFLSVPIVTGLVYGGGFTEFGLSEYITDLKFPLMLIGSILLYGSLLRAHPHWTPSLVAALFGVLLARHFIDLIYLVMNYGPETIAGVSRSSNDSAKGAVNLLILLGLLTIFAAGRHRLLGLTLVVLFGALSFAYATKLIWVGLVVGLLVLLAFLNISRRLLVVTCIPVFLVSAAALLAILNPGSALVALLRAGTVTEGRPAATFAVDVDYNVVSRIDPIRYGESVNLLDAMGRRGAYLWGTGYAGYYEDNKVNFDERRMGTAFPSYMYQSGRFFLARLFVTHIFLKHGVLGLIFISSVWIVPAFLIVRNFRRTGVFGAKRPMIMFIMIGGLTAYLPTSMLHNYWSGKGLFLSGIVLALCLRFAGELVGTEAMSRRAHLLQARGV